MLVLKGSNLKIMRETMRILKMMTMTR